MPIAISKRWKTAPDPDVNFRVAASFHDIDRDRWNALALDGCPFLRHEFLLALEDSGSATAATGWRGQHLLLEAADGRLLGAMPLYLKSHSFGEFVFDFSWAEAYARAGIAYYPKLVAGVPFTPATGPRLLVSPLAEADDIRGKLLQGAENLAAELGVSSLHLQFCQQDELAVAVAAGWLPRMDCQFHWLDRGEQGFADFLQSLTAAKRKKLLRERRRVREQGINFVTLESGDLDQHALDEAWRMHASTFERHGNPAYLSREFFRLLAADLPQVLRIEFAELDGQRVACTICYQGEQALYGRYWGADGQFHSLHFEMCYYRGIEHCLQSGLQRFEPGTQGEHKLLRGFQPQPVWSAHRIRDPRFNAALASWLERERAQVASYIEMAAAHLPFRASEMPATLSDHVRDYLPRQ